MPQKKTSLDALTEVAEGVARTTGFHLVDLDLAGGARRRIVRVTIDKEGGVSLDDCQFYSRELEERLDALAGTDNAIGALSGPYVLEVESPGLDRALKKDREFEYFKGRTVRVSTYGPIDGRRRFIGTLLGLRDGHVELAGPDGEHWSIPRAQVARARLYVDFGGRG